MTQTVTVLPAAAESRHFGLAIGRCAWRSAADVAASLQAAAAQQLSLLVARCDASDFPTLQAAAALGCLPTDVLLELAAAPADLETPLPAGVTLRTAEAADTPALEALACAAFAGYGGHYRHDPRIAPERADALYPAWLRDAAAAAADPATPLWLAERAGTPLGFCVLARQRDTLDVRLLAVAPTARHSGIFAALLAAAAVLAAEYGLPRVRYTTQLNNIAAQRAAQRCGLRSVGAQMTFHAWLDHSTLSSASTADPASRLPDLSAPAP